MIYLIYVTLDSNPLSGTRKYDFLTQLLERECRLVKLEISLL